MIWGDDGGCGGLCGCGCGCFMLLIGLAILGVLSLFF